MHQDKDGSNVMFLRSFAISLLLNTCNSVTVYAFFRLVNKFLLYYFIRSDTNAAAAEK